MSSSNGIKATRVHGTVFRFPNSPTTVNRSWSEAATTLYTSPPYRRAYIDHFLTTDS